MTDNRYFMSLMKPLTRTLNYMESNTFKNIIIVFGVALSIFTITSFESISNPSENSFANEGTQIQCEDKIGEENLAIDKSDINSSRKAKTHHNFIASYFIQESSIKRERRKREPGLYYCLCRWRKQCCRCFLSLPGKKGGETHSR